MRALVTLLAGTLLLATSAGAAPRLSPEARLAQALEGRVAGEPVDCINTSRVRSSRIIDDTAILYDDGSTIYVNHPRAGRESLDRWDTLVTRQFTSQLCSTDVVELYDTSARIHTGLVFLGKFVPYKKVRTRSPR
jgi:hypothetical protein